MRTQNTLRPARRYFGQRRGIALFVSLFFVAGVGALALSAIYLNANATLLGQTYEKEDALRYAAEAGLAIGKGELNFNPGALPNTSYVYLMHNLTLPTADNSTVAGITVNVYAGPTGSTNGQFGRFASVVSEARDNGNHTGFVRRLELTQESFAKYAYWTNSEGANISFGNGDQLWGPVWSNDTIHINVSGAEFHDVVGTAKVIAGVASGTFDKGYLQNQHPITLPSTASLATSLPPIATAGGMNFTPPTTGSDTLVRMRVEFMAFDLNGDGDSTDADEGWFRLYTATTGNQHWLRADWPSGALATPSTLINCGDWHKVRTTGDTSLKFFPFASHIHPADSHGNTTNTWFDTVTARGMTGGATAANIAKAHAEGDSLSGNISGSGPGTPAKVAAVLQHTNSRCYLGGDPHLVATARTTAAGNGHYADTLVHKGGEDTTFTPIDQYGSWTRYSTTPLAALVTARPGDNQYLQPLYRGYNNNKGVMYFNGTIGVSGILRGVITLYSPYNIVFLDDTRYSNDPANVNNPTKTDCLDILGTISGLNTVVADNSLNTPQIVKSGSPNVYKVFDESPDFTLEDVVMALGTGFTVQNYDSGPTNATACQTTTWGHGCLFLTGGLIQQTRGAVGQSNGTGYVKRYNYDHCATINPPPYFPTTGKFTDNRYYELDPVTFNATKLFQQLTPK